MRHCLSRDGNDPGGECWKFAGAHTSCHKRSGSLLPLDSGIGVVSKALCRKALAQEELLCSRSPNIPADTSRDLLPVPAAQT